jgi:hypothetical protein
MFTLGGPMTRAFESTPVLKTSLGRRPARSVPRPPANSLPNAGCPRFSTEEDWS